jgi:SAM-dependent methyltransferase
MKVMPMSASDSPRPYRTFDRPTSLAAHASFFDRFLDLVHERPGVRAGHRRTIELLGVQTGFRLLDVGCGAGHFVRDAATLVGETGRVVGVDRSATMTASAIARVAGLNLPVDVVTADARALPFRDAAFDGCRVERVLRYLPDPAPALAEMRRVTTPGGRVVATELDWDTAVCDLPGVERSVWRRAVAAIGDEVGNGWMGRELRRRFLEAGFADVTSDGIAIVYDDAGQLLDDLLLRSSLERARDAGAISPEETSRLIAGIETAGRAGQCFFAMTAFTVSGRVPLPG